MKIGTFAVSENWPITPMFRIAYKLYPVSVSGNGLFRSVVEHWIFNPEARIRFPPRLCDFFQPNLLCSLLQFSCCENRMLRFRIGTVICQASNQNKFLSLNKHTG